MHPTEFLRVLAQDRIAPVYLFVGEADLLLQEAWGRLVEKMVPVSARRYNGERWSAKEHPPAQVLAHLGTLPMFGSKRLLMVQSIEAWTKDQRTALLAYLAKPYPSACLVLTASGKKGMEKIETAVNGVGATVHFALPAEKDAPRWLQERAGLQGKVLTPQAAAGLIELVGVDLQRLERELEKLSAYVGSREKIELEDVRQAVSAQRSFSAFQLLRAVGRHESGQAVRTLRNLMASGEPPLPLLALLARQVRLVWQIKDGLAQGLDVNRLTQKLNLPAFAVKNYAQQASHFSEAQLFAMHRALREADLALKSTGTAPEVMLESLILGLSQESKKPSRR